MERRSAGPSCSSVLLSSVLRHASGSVLIVTLLILIVLTSLALLLGRSMRAEASGAANNVAQIQAMAVAQGALAYVEAELAGFKGQPLQEGDFADQAVPIGQGYFWLLKHDPGDDAGYVFGVTDAPSKLNLNTATQQMLSELPNMTRNLAAAAIDWRDGDDDITGGGAESQSYLMLPTPYRAKNAPLETVEELLLVKGFTPSLLFGQDGNRNGVLDAGEGANTIGRSWHGLADYVTVYSRQPNTDAAGRARVNINTASLDSIRHALDDSLSGGRLSGVMDRLRQGRPFSNVIDFYDRAGLTKSEFAGIADRLTTVAGQTLTGMVNLNTASSEVLACLPRMTDGDAQAIVAHRGGGAVFDSLADLIDVVPRDKAIAIGGLVTVRSYRYAADIVAVDGTGRSFQRLWVVLDVSSNPPRVLYRRNLTSLGWPLDPRILDDLRAGRSIRG